MLERDFFGLQHQHDAGSSVGGGVSRSSENFVEEMSDERDHPLQFYINLDRYRLFFNQRSPLLCYLSIRHSSFLLPVSV